MMQQMEGVWATQRDWMMKQVTTDGSRKMAAGHRSGTLVALCRPAAAATAARMV
jgi:hypothetical protein